MSVYVKASGVWKGAKLYIKDGGLWKPVVNGYVKDGGVWKRHYGAFSSEAALFDYLEDEFSPYARTGNQSVYMGVNNSAGLIVSSLTKNGTMWGTPWGSHCTTDSALSRVVQHGLPSESQFTQQINNNGRVFLTVQYLGNLGHSSMTRNGYTSYPYGSFPAVKIPRLIYWDYAEEKAFEMQPALQLGPEPYYGE